MQAPLSWGKGVLALLLAAGALTAAEPARQEPRPPEPGRSARKPVVPDAFALSEKIDQELSRHWTEAKAEPAPRSDDAEFLRRVYLDLVGRIPSVQQTRTFLEDKRPDKRTRLIEQLLTGPRYVTHFTNVWRALLLPEANNNFQVRLQQGSFEAWLKKQVTENAGYDRMVSALITAPIGGGGGNPLALLAALEPGPLPYYLAKEFKPENLAAGTARVFLGISVECAQCHNHPFAELETRTVLGFRRVLLRYQVAAIDGFPPSGGRRQRQA